jgi:hypothetical protein
MKEGKTKNTGNILRFACRQHINAPEELTLEELKDGLQFAQIRKADLRKQAKGLQQVHLRDCLIDKQEKKQHNQAAAIKQKCQREESKRMWFLIKRTVKKPQSPRTKHAAGAKGSKWRGKRICGARRRRTGNPEGV